MEIETVLKSGKPLLPVLVSGAAMPIEADLPSNIRALARRQAIVLSDVGWSSDVARLIESIRPLLPARRRLYWRQFLLGGLAAVALLVTVPRDYWPGTPDTSPAAITLNPTGRWTARITYDWGEEYEETFDLKLENGEAHGTASYLRVPRIVEQGQVQGDRLSFITHSEEVLGEARRELTHRYRGLLKAGELHFVLESSGSQLPHDPVEFIAGRDPK